MDGKSIVLGKILVVMLIFVLMTMVMPGGIAQADKVSNCIYFNTGEWTDLSSVFTGGTEIYGGTNNKIGGTAYIHVSVALF